MYQRGVTGNGGVVVMHHDGDSTSFILRSTEWRFHDGITLTLEISFGR